MSVRRVESLAAVTEKSGMVAIERGPLVYCLEGIDNDGHVLDRALADTASFRADWQPDLLHGVNAVRAQHAAGDLIFVPYYACGPRGLGEMTVWMAREKGA